MLHLETKRRSEQDFAEASGAAAPVPSGAPGGRQEGVMLFPGGCSAAGPAPRTHSRRAPRGLPPACGRGPWIRSLDADTATVETGCLSAFGARCLDAHCLNEFPQTEVDLLDVMTHRTRCS